MEKHVNNKTMLAVGLFDKDTKRQEIPTKQAFDIINKCLMESVEGATCYLGNGIYKHIDKTLVCEPNIIILLYDVDKKTINNIINKLCKLLNQECIMQETSVCSLSFSNGKD